ncbi:MAG: hypothetical protein JWO86_6311 [Myxococcaceae bacterium]|nr:hypothetical protein [Myxococcaceae bacterium]
MLKQKLVLLLTCLAVMFGAACAPETPPPLARRATVKAESKVFTATASKTTQAKLGITRWHMVLESGSNIVIDGANAKGEVKFSTAFHRDVHKLRIESYGQRGTLTIDSKTRALSANTLPSGWATYAAAFGADWKTFHKQQKAYSFLSDSSYYLDLTSKAAYGVATVAGGVAAIAAVVPGGQGVAAAAGTVAAGAAGVGAIASGLSSLAGVADQAINGAGPPGSASAAAGSDTAAAGSDPATGGNDPSTAGTDPSMPAGDPSSDPSTTPGSDPSTDPSATPGSDPSSDPSTTPGSDPSSDPSTAGQGDPLPDTNTDNNLDNSSSADNSGADNSGGDTSGGDTSGGDTSGGDTSGGDYGTHAKCRVVSCSVSIAACICKHY